jgi:hypothetical protein
MLAGLAAAFLCGCGTNDVPAADFIPSPDNAGSPDLAKPTAPLPFVVSDQYYASGYMGTDQSAQSRLFLDSDPHDCLQPRMPGAQGECYTLGWYLPSTPAWAGVYWQWPSSNWGTQPCKQVPPGATQVSFYAAGAVGGERVTFIAGGINFPNNAKNGPYGDSFTAPNVPAPLPTTLTTTWKRYSIPLPDVTYPNGVCGPFAWSVATADLNDAGLTPVMAGDASIQQVTFYVDGLVWTNAMDGISDE